MLSLISTHCLDAQEHNIITRIMALQKCLIIVKVEIEQSTNCKCMKFFKKKYIHANFTTPTLLGRCNVFINILYVYVMMSFSNRYLLLLLKKTLLLQLTFLRRCI